MLIILNTLKPNLTIEHFIFAVDNFPLGRHMYSSYPNVFIQFKLHLGDEFYGRAKYLKMRDQRSFVFIFLTIIS